MPIDEQIIRLALDLGASPEEAAKLSAALDRINASGAKAASEGLARAEAEIDSLIGSASQAAIPLESLADKFDEAVDAAMAEAAALDKVGGEMDAVAGQAGKLEAATEKAARGKNNLARAALQASYGLQDFSTNGILGAMNNIDQVALALTGSAGIGVAFSLFATALYLSRNQIREWIDTISGAGSNEIPKTGDALRDLSDELDQVNKRIDKYKDSQSLTNAEVVTYNELLARQVDLEARKSAEQEKQARIKRALTSVDDEQAQRASTFSKAIAGQGPEVLRAMEQAMDKDAQFRIYREEAQAQRDVEKIAAGGGTVDEKIAATNRRIAELDAFRATEGGSNEALARQFFDELLQGAPGAQDRLTRLMDAGTGVSFGGLKARLQQNDPTYQAWIKAAEEEIEAAEKTAEKEAEKAAKLQEWIDKEEDAIAAAGDKAAAADDARLAAEIETAMKAEDQVNARLEALWKRQDKAKADDAADLIKRATGGALGADLTREAAEMSVQLQRQGLDANAATQQAIGAALQAMRQMASEAAMQRRDSMMLIQQATALQQAMRAEFNPRLQPFQPRAR